MEAGRLSADVEILENTERQDHSGGGEQLEAGRDLAVSVGMLSTALPL